jgi:hypothetical protein
MLPEPQYTVELVEKGRSRYYAVRRGDSVERVKSVTQILDVVVNKPALQRWYAKTTAENIQAALMERLKGEESKRIVLNRAWIEEVIAEGKKRPKAVASEAAGLGTLCHACFEAIVNVKPLPEIPEYIKPAVHEFARWFRTSNIKPLATELRVASVAHLYGGTLDFLGERGGSYGIIDYKTSNGIYTEMALQAAGGYKAAVEEMYGIKIAWVEIVRFSKAPPFGSEVFTIQDLRSAEEGFLAGVKLARILDIPFIGEPTYSTFATNAADADNLQAATKAQAKIQKGEVPF